MKPILLAILAIKINIAFRLELDTVACLMSELRTYSLVKRGREAERRGRGLVNAEAFSLIGSKKLKDT